MWGQHSKKNFQCKGFFFNHGGEGPHFYFNNQSSLKGSHRIYSTSADFLAVFTTSQVFHSTSSSGAIHKTTVAHLPWGNEGATEVRTQVQGIGTRAFH